MNLTLTASILALTHVADLPPDPPPATESLQSQSLQLQPSPAASEATAQPTESLQSQPLQLQSPPAARETIAAPHRLAPLDTAATLPRGAVTLGVFGPLRWGLRDDVELEIHPLLSLLAPSPTVRVRYLRTSRLTLTGEYGLSYPSLLLGLTRGFLFPSGDREPCGAPCGDSGLPHHLVLEAGAVASLDLGAAGVTSLRATLRGGVPLTEGALTPLDSLLAPLEVLLAPVTRGWHLRVAGGWDGALGPDLRARTTLAVHLMGPTPEGFAATSPWVFSWHAALDLALGAAGSRLTAGLMLWSWDARATELVRRPDGTSVRRAVRSLDVLPTFDYVHAF
jgi:hypothetical protein